MIVRIALCGHLATTDIHGLRAVANIMVQLRCCLFLWLSWCSMYFTCYFFRCACTPLYFNNLLNL
jgi:hypothetical protein